MKTGFSNEWDTEDGLHNEINVTPFIDVVLVLLIVFMVAAPLATSVIPVQLPSMSQTLSVAQPDEPFYVVLQKDHSLYIGDKLVGESGFVESLFKETNRNLNAKILIKADREVDYGAVVDLLNKMRVAGYTKVGLVGLQKSSGISEEEGLVRDETASTVNDAGVVTDDNVAGQ
ncbi:biopolymer transporter ExbD [Bartonella sp. B41]